MRPRRLSVGLRAIQNIEISRHFILSQAIAFKKHLAEQKGQQSGEKLSKATLHATLTQLKRFFRMALG